MNKIERQIERFRSLDFDNIFKEAVVETKDFLLGHIKQRMLEGKASDGGELGTYALIEYAKFKDQFVADYLAPFGKYNLSLTGSFHDKMYIGFDLQSNIVISSSDHKTSYLIGLVDKNRGNGAQMIFGMMDNDLSEYRKQIFPVIMRKIRAHLGY